MVKLLDSMVCDDIKKAWKPHKGEDHKPPHSCNLYDKAPDFINNHGWSVAIDGSDYSPLKMSGVGIYHVNLSAVCTIFGPCVFSSTDTTYWATVGSSRPSERNQVREHKMRRSNDDSTHESNGNRVWNSVERLWKNPASVSKRNQCNGRRDQRRRCVLCAKVLPILPNSIKEPTIGVLRLHHLCK
ncbi:hypothetical protein PIB30_046346 [Stylosanthes scabra]|uniref:Uncharacterized protein n=1 Tax=Stylosanthes scabra TaxID=79078 RepID=A0ABU6WG58_9FABA|nr:hypothetical protein [Stylosanthes scabra]